MDHIFLRTGLSPKKLETLMVQFMLGVPSVVLSTARDNMGNYQSLSIVVVANEADSYAYNL